MSKIDVGQKKTAFLSGEFVAFIVLVLIQTLPVFYFQYFPTWDGPAHLGSAAVLSSYNNPDTAIFHEYFLINWLPIPNLLGHLVLLLLLKALTPIWADKILIILILVLTPLSIRYCIGSLNPGAKYLSFLAIPLANHWFLHAGLYNFSLGIPLCFFSLGYWLNHREKMGIRELFVCALLLVLTYLSHIVSFFILLLFLFGFILLDYLSKVIFHRQQRNLTPIVSPFREMSILVACAPSLILTAIYFFSTSADNKISRLPLSDLIKELGTLRSVMLVFHRWEYLFSILLSLTILSLTAYVLFAHVFKHGEYQHMTYFVIPLAMTVLYFVAPDNLADGTFLNARLAVFCYLALLLWLSVFKVGTPVRWVVIAASILITPGLMSLRIPFYVSFNNELIEYLSVAPVLERNSTILPLFYVYDGAHANDEGAATPGMAYSLRTRPLDHAAGYLMVSNGVVNLAHYESAFDYFPLQYRPELDPFIYLGSGSRWVEYIPPDVNIMNYSQQSIGSIDYVLVWGMNAASQDVLSDPRTILVAEQLAADYELIFVSEPRGLMQVYKRLSDP